MVVSVVVTALASVGSVACRKSSEEQLREAQKATEEAEQKASQTTITSAEIEPAKQSEAEDEARVARDRALREHAEAITAARNEQLAYRAKLQAALDKLDVQRHGAKTRGHVHVKAIDGKREVLKHHLDSLDRTTDTEWASLKAKIDRDLEDHAHADHHADHADHHGDEKQ